jgi:hypothetical protein
MQRQKKIIILVLFVVLTANFGLADRLPSQVPENQIFTIDTLIDVTGAVNEGSEMQWTLDSQDITTTTYTGDDVTLAGLVEEYGADDSVTVTDLLNALNAIKGDGSKPISVINATNENNTINSISIPQGISDSKFIDEAKFPGFTVGDLKAELIDYTTSTSHDYGAIHNSKLNPTEEIMILTWTDSLRTNGGKLSLNKNIDFDSQNKGEGLSNLEVEKVLTYASTEGAHLVGAEEWTLDIAGNWEKSADSIRCVFASPGVSYLPAFCNVVKAKSELININSAQISTKGAARAVVATGDIPAILNYQIAVTPDSNSGSGFADGTVKTLFGGSIMEARKTNQETSATNNWKDGASVSGGIKTFQKSFNYESGIMGTLPDDSEVSSGTSTPTPTQQGFRIIPDQNTVNAFAKAMADLIANAGRPSDWTVEIFIDDVKKGELWVDPDNFRTTPIEIDGLTVGEHVITSVGKDPEVDARVPSEYKRFTETVPEGEMKDVYMHFPRA